MREPAFWWQPGRGSLLSPLAAIYGAAAWLRMQPPGQRAGVPVICLGNLTVGGAGKTPAALAVAHILLAAHERPFFLSRGYGGRLAGPLRVNPPVHSAADVGDEPLMLTRLAPAVVARNRVAGAKFARFAGASVIVMDDGFQNPSLAKDLSVILVDGHRGIGNGRIIPAGPLRAPLEIQIAHAQAVVIVGPPERAVGVVDVARRYGAAVFHGRLEPDRNVVAALGRRKVLAFAGIANPEKFFATLTEAGVDVADSRELSRPPSLYGGGSTDAHRARRCRKPRARHHGEGPGSAYRRSAACRTRRARQRLAGAPYHRGSDRISTNGPECGETLVGAAILPALRFPIAGRMPLQHRLGRRIGFLQLDAPIPQLLERDRHPCHRAAHKGARPHDAKIAIEIFDVGLAGHGNRTISTIEQIDLRSAPIPPPNRPRLIGRNIIVPPPPRNPRSCDGGILRRHSGP